MGLKYLVVNLWLL